MNKFQAVDEKGIPDLHPALFSFQPGDDVSINKDGRLSSLADRHLPVLYAVMNHSPAPKGSVGSNPASHTISPGYSYLKKMPLCNSTNNVL